MAVDISAAKWRSADYARIHDRDGAAEGGREHQRARLLTHAAEAERAARPLLAAGYRAAAARLDGPSPRGGDVGKRRHEKRVAP